jgi:lipopolysaccharide/colanic/teichoic acid biosynthesis glycosyltransferase
MGMVKYGYASSVEMMLTRLQYDKVYYQHATWCTELSVFVKTIKTILKGRGV